MLLLHSNTITLDASISIHEIQLGTLVPCNAHACRCCKYWNVWPTQVYHGAEIFENVFWHIVTMFKCNFAWCRNVYPFEPSRKPSLHWIFPADVANTSTFYQKMIQHGEIVKNVFRHFVRIQFCLMWLFLSIGTVLEHLPCTAQAVYIDVANTSTFQKNRRVHNGEIVENVL